MKLDPIRPIFLEQQLFKDSKERVGGKGWYKEGEMVEKNVEVRE